MRSTVIVCTIVFVFAMCAVALAARPGAREEDSDQLSQRDGVLILPDFDLLGPPDHVVPVSGTDGNDVIGGTPAEDHIRGLGGDDQLSGAGSGDILEGGPGNDVLLGQAGDDHLRGNTGGDDLVGDEGDDTIMAGPGADELFPGPGNDVAMGGPGMDEFSYDSADNPGASDFYDGGPGYDLVTLYMPSDFSTTDRDEILNEFSMSGGNMSLATWGMDLVIANFEDMVVDIASPTGKLAGQPLATEDATWGGIKALYR